MYVYTVIGASRGYGEIPLNTSQLGGQRLGMGCTEYALTFAGLNFRRLPIFAVFTFCFRGLQRKCGMKLWRMAIDPRKLRKFNPAKVKAYTVSRVKTFAIYNNKFVTQKRI